MTETVLVYAAGRSPVAWLPTAQLTTGHSRALAPLAGQPVAATNSSSSGRPGFLLAPIASH